MDYKKEFERMMKTQTEIALATAAGGVPNVRIVNFYYDPQQKTLYFSSFADNQKIAELMQNPRVAFTTIAKNGEEHVRVKRAFVCESAVNMETVKPKFLAKLPDYIMGIPELLPALVLYEVTFDTAEVVLDLERMETISLAATSQDAAR